MEQTSAQWWETTRNDSEALAAWLQRQHVGELSAVILINTLMLKFGDEISEEDYKNLAAVSAQEARHVGWVRGLLDSRGIKALKDPHAHDRYWKDILANVTSYKDALQAAAVAETMRLHRIQAITESEHRYDQADIQMVFRRILVDETWHAEIFAQMQADYFNPLLETAHETGLAALGLALE